MTKAKDAMTKIFGLIDKRVDAALNTVTDSIYEYIDDISK